MPCDQWKCELRLSERYMYINKEVTRNIHSIIVKINSFSYTESKKMTFLRMKTEAANETHPTTSKRNLHNNQHEM